MTYNELKKRLKNFITVDEDGLFLEVGIRDFHVVKNLELFDDSFIIKVIEGFAILPYNTYGIGYVKDLRMAEIDEVLYLAMSEGKTDYI